MNDKETCKWKFFSGEKLCGHNIECTKFPPPRCIDRLSGMKFCPYCGKEIEEIEEVKQ